MARAYDPCLRSQAAHHQGMLRPALRPGDGPLLPPRRRRWKTRLRLGLCLIPIGLAILSLILVNAQGVTALTSERDTGALDLLLVTELTPKEFIYGKLYGILYNSKEMIALPVLTAIAMAFLGMLIGENLVSFLIDFLLLCHFSAMLGLHAAITLHQQPDRRGQ